MSVSKTLRSFGRRLGRKLPNRHGPSSSISFEVPGGGRVARTSADVEAKMDPRTPEADTESSIPHGAITIVGSINMDYIGLVDMHAELDRHVHVRADKSIKMPGGHGLNQAVACVRLSHYRPNEPDRSTEGSLPPRKISTSSRLDRTLAPHDIDISVKIMGTVGERDEHFIRDELHNHNIDINHLRTEPGVDTGAARITVDKDGHSKVESFANANDMLRPEHIAALDPRPDLLLVQLEIPVDTALHAVRMAQETTPPVPVIFNPAPDARITPADLWKVDHLILNAGIADEFFRGGIKPGRGVQSKGTGARTVKEYWDDCEQFHDLGARCVIITMGQNGAIASVRETNRSGRPRMFYSGALVAPSPATVKDTTGASDAFIGAYAVEILRQIKSGEEEDINRAMEMGIKTGGLTVSSVGSMNSIPWRAEVLDTDFVGVDGVGG